ncbi:MAG TPA: GNAT family N-acetyltransferase [Acidimicrobiales bacterium]|nr:GNAT family N-acetyltransferase [Acidimicrobiales bacterium]
MESARPATGADLDELVRLWNEAVGELAGQRGGGALAATLTRKDLPGFLRAALEDPDRLLVLGHYDGSPVGVASAWADRDRVVAIGQLELIYVEPTARQVGVAEAMLELVTDRCREWGLAGFDAPALPGNRSAKSFFERNGMQARLLIMHRPLTSRADG